MAIFSQRTLASLIFIGIASTINSEDIKLEHHLEHLTTIRNPSAFDKTAWFDTRNYIFDQFQSYKLKTKFQSFNTSVNDNDVDTTVTGKNVIGIAEGPVGGPVIVVGADYDTRLLQYSPLEDNGAGVAALLEIARNYMSQIYSNGNYTNMGTVVFVAFDVNTREYDGKSAGQPGSYHFLHQWLWPYLHQTSDKFSGAIILDSISKYNMEDKSQVLPNDFENFFPGAKDDIVRRGYRGDFLALITRKSERNGRLSQALYDHYNKDQKARMFRLLDLTIKDGADYGETVEMFNHQSHYHFWTFQPSTDPMPLPALLLTDTDVHRKSADTCNSPCKASTFLTNPKKAFVTKTVQALIETLASLQTDRFSIPGPDVGNSGMGLMPSFSIMAVTMVIRKIFQ